MQILGIDIGGTGIKGALVETSTGELMTPRHRLLTPEGARPDDVAKVVGELVRHFQYSGPIGCGFPAVVRGGVAYSAANIHKSWIGLDTEDLFSSVSGGPVLVLNDADAAGIAEITFGAGKGQPGVVLMLTVGTGIGSGLFINGQLVPNTELGHLEVEGEDAELRASDAARQRDDLSWKKWAKRFNKYLATVERLFSPDLLILGGGVVKNFDEYSEHLKTSVPLVPAQMLNEAGIIGAALAAGHLATAA